AEILAALFNSLFLFGVTFWIIAEGIRRLINPQPVLVPEMFLIAVLGLVVNIITMKILQGSTHDLNIRGAFIHMLSDLLSSVAIIVGAVVIYFSGLNIIDSLLSIGIALVILVWGFGLFRDSINILLEAAPKGVNSEDVIKILLEKFPKIEEVTNIHLWTITSSMHFITLHIRVKPQLTSKEEKDLIADVKQLIKEYFGIEHSTIEIV
nr:cation transporter [Candidatus Omnitrophota bacterium]